MPQAIQLIDEALIQATISRASASPRLRTNHNFHQSPEDNPHRFLNVLISGTYCQPHRHLKPPKCEAFLVLRGQVGVLTYSDSGHVLERVRLSADGTLGVDIEPGIWHSIVSLSRVAVCYEVKPGPWVAATDKEFAPWAPPEGGSGASEYLKSLLAGF